MRPAQHRHASRSSASSTTGSVRELPKITPKYGNIKAAIDSGLNMLKINEKYPEAKINARFKKEENFRRMKVSTLLRLLDEKQIECLILDIRDKELFDKCHVKGALSYPAPLLRRSVNVFTVEILSFMNKEPEKIIIFYDEDEHTGTYTGNLFVEKGVENIFMLVGGLREVAMNYPDMIEGHYVISPGNCPLTPFSRLSTSNSSRMSSRMSTTSSRMSTTSSRMSSRMSTRPRYSSASRIRV